MKIFASGADSAINQISRIRDGFLMLGHEIVDDPRRADLIYVNNPWFNDVIALKEELKGKIVFNVLDIPIHLLPNNYDLGKLRSQLLYADAITTISHKVKKDIYDYIGLDSCVIYNPIKDVSLDKSIKYNGVKYLAVGRMNDPNKRFRLAAEGIFLATGTTKGLCVCGTENPVMGNYIGMVDDAKLNILYNNTEYVICTGKIEGLCLPLIEGIICGAIPIVCNDNPTAREILGDAIWKKFYENVDPTPESIAAFLRRMEKPEEKKALQFDLLVLARFELEEKFNKLSIAKNIINVYNDLY